jgi:protein-ribulosamine 3-kinase
MLSSVPLEIIEFLQEKYGYKANGFSPASGGCINHGGKLKTGAGNFFLKWNDAITYPQMFETEVLGLRLLASAEAVHVPEVIGHGQTASYQFILLEYISSGSRSNKFWTTLGTELANLHRVSATMFGLDYDNYIGSLRQYNSYKEDWINFFIEQRLAIQVNIAIQKELIDAALANQFERLYKRLPALLPTEKASLLHGDLWSGNIIVNTKGGPCMIDPAVYYGHREAELAFTHLFGGFDPAFYESYQEAFPLAPDFAKRIEIYNLYPLLVHVNLFGETYVQQVQSIMKHLK